MAGLELSEYPAGRRVDVADLWLSNAAAFGVGLIVGLVIGWLIIRPVNAGLAWVFGKFNKGFDKITSAYGWTVAKLLRIAVIVMAAYGGLLFLTWWRVATAQTGFIPEQDQGYLLANIQLPDAASVQRTRSGHCQDRQDRPRHPRRRAHGRHRRRIVLALGQQLQPGIDVRRARALR